MDKSQGVDRDWDFRGRDVLSVCSRISRLARSRSSPFIGRTHPREYKSAASENHIAIQLARLAFCSACWRESPRLGYVQSSATKTRQVQSGTMMAATALEVTECSTALSGKLGHHRGRRWINPPPPHPALFQSTTGVSPWQDDEIAEH